MLMHMAPAVSFSVLLLLLHACVVVAPYIFLPDLLCGNALCCCQNIKCVLCIHFILNAQTFCWQSPRNFPRSLSPLRAAKDELSRRAKTATTEQRTTATTEQRRGSMTAIMTTTVAIIAISAKKTWTSNSGNWYIPPFPFDRCPAHHVVFCSIHIVFCISHMPCCACCLVTGFSLHQYRNFGDTRVTYPTSHGM